MDELNRSNGPPTWSTARSSSTRPLAISVVFVTVAAGDVYVYELTKLDTVITYERRHSWSTAGGSYSSPAPSTIPSSWVADLEVQVKRPQRHWVLRLLGRIWIRDGCGKCRALRLIPLILHEHSWRVHRLNHSCIPGLIDGFRWFQSYLQVHTS
jgi:hypothetical protein